MNFGFWLGIYLALGLPIALGLAMTESGAPLIRRVTVSLIMLPFWPVWSIELVVLHYQRMQMFRRRATCAWCGEIAGDDNEKWRVHLMVCKQHPIRLWLQAQGWDITEDDDGVYVLGEYIAPDDKRWKVTEYEDKVTILPLNDLREHDEESETCACEPKIEVVNGKRIVTHQAYDFREVAEYLNDKDGEQ